MVVFSPRISQTSDARLDESAKRDLHLALIRLPENLLDEVWPELERDAETVLCLRSVLMKPEHEAWVPEILARLRAACDEAQA